MNSMKQESLMRLAISLDNQGPTTLDKYICRLVESILCDTSAGILTAVELCKKINDVYGLEFDVDEVKDAIKRRGEKNILIVSGQYSLNPKKREDLIKIADINNSLKKHIENYIDETKADCNVSELSELLRRYLYHCLNSNITNLMSLLNRKYLDGLSSFSASNEEILAINNFINWENDEKNRFLYTIVSFSYAYCMLTIKRDSLLSSGIFKGKRFSLDTNLIFRMAGINKDERQFVINSFISKCNDVGIELYYTSETLREIYRVINSQMGYIRHLTQGQEPISLEVMEMFDADQEINDFYEIFDRWCREPQNKSNDLLSFQQYLMDLVHNVVSNLNYVEIPNYALEGKSDGFQEKCVSLKQFKEERRRKRSTTKESVRTDVNNVLYTLSLRKGQREQNLWQTKDFFVSADQLLTEWAQTELSGVPIVVIPSVWLSIILRFTGRSSDDYKTFCLFLNLRYHKIDDEEILVKPSILLPILAQKTIDKNIKEKVILEIIRNCDNQKLKSFEDYEQATDKAFDKYINEVKAENALQLNLEAQRYNQQLEEENQAAKLSNQYVEEETIERLSRNQASKKVQFWENVLFLRYILWVICAITWFISVLMFCASGKTPVPTPKIFVDINMGWDFIKWIGVAIGFVFVGIGELINYLSSDKREKILYRKYYKANKKNNEDRN